MHLYADLGIKIAKAPEVKGYKTHKIKNSKGVVLLAQPYL